MRQENDNTVNVTQILSKVESGDSQAASELLPLIYDELRQLAAARMVNERADHTLQSTALAPVEDIPASDPLVALTPMFLTDVNGDGSVSPLDALLIINRLKSESREDGDFALDTNRDDRITALDALRVINRLQRRDHSTPGEGKLLSAPAIDDYFTGGVAFENKPLIAPPSGKPCLAIVLRS